MSNEFSSELRAAASLPGGACRPTPLVAVTPAALPPHPVTAALTHLIARGLPLPPQKDHRGEAPRAMSFEVFTDSVNPALGRSASYGAVVVVSDWLRAFDEEPVVSYWLLRNPVFTLQCCTAVFAHVNSTAGGGDTVRAWSVVLVDRSTAASLATVLSLLLARPRDGSIEPPWFVGIARIIGQPLVVAGAVAVSLCAHGPSHDVAGAPLGLTVFEALISRAVFESTFGTAASTDSFHVGDEVRVVGHVVTQGNRGVSSPAALHVTSIAILTPPEEGGGSGGSDRSHRHHDDDDDDDGLGAVAGHADTADAAGLDLAFGRTAATWIDTYGLPMRLDGTAPAPLRSEPLGVGSATVPIPPPLRRFALCAGIQATVPVSVVVACLLSYVSSTIAGDRRAPTSMPSTRLAQTDDCAESDATAAVAAGGGGGLADGGRCAEALLSRSRWHCAILGGCVDSVSIVMAAIDVAATGSQPFGTACDGRVVALCASGLVESVCLTTKGLAQTRPGLALSESSNRFNIRMATQGRMSGTGGVVQSPRFVAPSYSASVVPRSAAVMTACHRRVLLFTAAGHAAEASKAAQLLLDHLRLDVFPIPGCSASSSDMGGIPSAVEGRCCFSLMLLLPKGCGAAAGHRGEASSRTLDALISAASSGSAQSAAGLEPVAVDTLRLANSCDFVAFGWPPAVAFSTPRGDGFMSRQCGHFLLNAAAVPADRNGEAASSWPRSHGAAVADCLAQVVARQLGGAASPTIRCTPRATALIESYARYARSVSVAASPTIAATLWQTARLHAELNAVAVTGSLLGHARSGGVLADSVPPVSVRLPLGVVLVTVIDAAVAVALYEVTLRSRCGKGAFRDAQDPTVMTTTRAGEETLGPTATDPSLALDLFDIVTAACATLQYPAGSAFEEASHAIASSFSFSRWLGHVEALMLEEDSVITSEC
mgnify:CR=1 FL=1